MYYAPVLEVVENKEVIQNVFKENRAYGAKFMRGIIQKGEMHGYPMMAFMPDISTVFNGSRLLFAAT